MKLKLLLIVFALSGCASLKEIVVKALPTTVVEVPVPVACLDAKDVQPRPQVTLPRSGGNIVNKDSAASADLLALDAYAKRAEAQLAGCARQP